MHCVLHCGLHYVLHCVLHCVLPWFNLIYLVYSMQIQCLFNVYSMSIQCLFIVHSMCIQYTFNVHSMFCYVLSVCLNDHLLTHLLSYPKSRDAIASKNDKWKKCRLNHSPSFIWVKDKIQFKLKLTHSLADLRKFVLSNPYNKGLVNAELIPMMWQIP